MGFLAPPRATTLFIVKIDSRSLLILCMTSNLQITVIVPLFISQLLDKRTSFRPSGSLVTRLLR